MILGDSTSLTTMTTYTNFYILEYTLYIRQGIFKPLYVTLISPQQHSRTIRVTSTP